MEDLEVIRIEPGTKDREVLPDARHPGTLLATEELARQLAAVEPDRWTRHTTPRRRGREFVLTDILLARQASWGHVVRNSVGATRVAGA